ncbi:MAG TPA: beta-L-arabinofuranosidase domain-containing protein, partial [Pedobacter sp.]|nr:beta-L-arabinofuranosidase domain-containing protein [Pedobacter sp.]
NGCLSGISLAGDRFFYPNPLASEGANRKEWFGTACCPSNIARLLASVGGYIYAQEQNKVWVNLYIGSSTKIKLANTAVDISQSDTFLQDGHVKLNINPKKESKFEISLRLPGWAAQAATDGDLYVAENFVSPKIQLSVNGKPMKYTLENGYVNIEKVWKKGDVVDFSLPMNILRMKANDLVVADMGRIALQRGPFVYCLEGIDNQEPTWTIANKATLTPVYEPNSFNGIATITVKDPVNPNATLKAIPYFTWANRGKSKMEVWVKKGD